MPNPEAMLTAMFGGDPAAINMEASQRGDRYERLFGLRDELVDHLRANRTHGVEVATRMIFQHLAEHFPEMPDDDDADRAQEIISGLFLNPREIEDLVESQIAVIEDAAVNVGIIRSLIYSYGIDLSKSAEFFPWMVRYRKYMVV
jgi:hypothetical protein